MGDDESNGLCMNCREVYYTVAEVAAFCVVSSAVTVLISIVVGLMCLNYYEKRILATLQNVPRSESAIEMSRLSISTSHYSTVAVSCMEEG